MIGLHIDGKTNGAVARLDGLVGGSGDGLSMSVDRNAGRVIFAGRQLQVHAHGNVASPFRWRPEYPCPPPHRHVANAVDMERRNRSVRLVPSGQLDGQARSHAEATRQLTLDRDIPKMKDILEPDGIGSARLTLFNCPDKRPRRRLIAVPYVDDPTLRLLYV